MSRYHTYIFALIATAVLVAIAGVLISPAVPSAPTLLPSALLMLTLSVVLCRGVTTARWMGRVSRHWELTGLVPDLSQQGASAPMRC